MLAPRDATCTRLTGLWARSRRVRPATTALTGAPPLAGTGVVAPVGSDAAGAPGRCPPRSRRTDPVTPTTPATSTTSTAATAAAGRNRRHDTSRRTWAVGHRRHEVVQRRRGPGLTPLATVVAERDLETVLGVAAPAHWNDLSGVADVADVAGVAEVADAAVFVVGAGRFGHRYSSPIARRSLARASDNVDFTVPSAQPRTTATSASGSPR